MTLERKNFDVELQLKKLDEGGMFEGYASVFGVQDSDGDVIVKGAFERTLKEFHARGKLPKMLWQHNPSIIVGKYTEMFEDDNGLFVKGHLILEVEKGREAYALMKAGELDAMSVGFNIANATPGDNRGRVIDDLDLWEISLVTWGANPEALISTVKCIDSKRDFERFLRDSGFSQKQAKRITSHGYDFDSETLSEDQEQRDVDSETIEKLRNLNKLIRG